MLGRIEALLIDLSGTLHIEDQIIPGAVEAIKKLRESPLKIKFVTNTTKESLRVLHNRLTDLDLKVDKNEIYTSLSAARSLIDSQRLRPYLMLEDEAKEDFEGVDQSDPNAVVIGLAPSCFMYNNMNKAFRLLMAGAKLIAIHKARYYRTLDGLSLGPGPFVECLQYASSSPATVVGKPQQQFFVGALQSLQVQPAHAVMIGDDVRDDIDGSMAAGMKGILVQTGKYLEGDEQKIEPRPTAVCRNFSEAVDLVLEARST